MVCLFCGITRDRAVFPQQHARVSGGVLTIEMQEIESVVDEPHPVRAIAGGLGLRKARQAVTPNAWNRLKSPKRGRR